eukprot:CAMPEP_0202881936 /NCGR_PEP_ID=MMETSP1391-20130828/37263_1 /ASSEMBLY_ACC=CAM_ASM_000867 /TAXON_ID=1034604 /ORGANISM="Chlamydomonas leiostraca, Strain SAG 11-49" /LENGTH=65 /DNA_ID=CAMNT_0049564699 /DNA_START=1017 /DNA_END=1214 /DNA_ORIENTATION=+
MRPSSRPHPFHPAVRHQHEACTAVPPTASAACEDRDSNACLCRAHRRKAAAAAGLTQCDRLARQK